MGRVKHCIMKGGLFAIDDESTTYQSSREADKAMFKGKCIILNAHEKT